MSNYSFRSILYALGSKYRKTVPGSATTAEKEETFAAFLARAYRLSLLWLLSFTYFFLVTLYGFSFLHALFLPGTVFFFPASSFSWLLPAAIGGFGFVLYGVFVVSARIEFREDWPAFIAWYRKKYNLRIYLLTKLAAWGGLTLMLLFSVLLFNTYLRFDEKNFYIKGAFMDGVYPLSKITHLDYRWDHHSGDREANIWIEKWDRGPYRLSDKPADPKKIDACMLWLSKKQKIKIGFYP